MINYFKLDISDPLETEDKENLDKNLNGYELINKISFDAETK